MKRILLAAFVLVLLTCSAGAQTITTFAGGGFADGVPATSVGVGTILGVAVDGDGNTFFAAPNLHIVFRVAPDGTLYRVAGVPSAGGYSGDGGPATSAVLRNPQDVAVDADGNIYIADSNNYRVRKVDTNGIITTVAGNGTYGFSGDGGPATGASLAYVYSLALDPAGNLFIGDGNSRIRRVAPNGVITTYAGTGTYGYSGDAGPATSANISYGYGLATDGVGNLFIADINNHRVRKVTTAGVITTVAGNGTAGYSGDGAAATAASLSTPRDVAFGSNGVLYIADQNNYRVRQVTSGGIISTVAGNGSSGNSSDGIPATSASIQPIAVAANVAGTLLIADIAGVRLRTVIGGVIGTLAGNGSYGTFSGDGGPATDATLYYPFNVARDASGNVYIADSNNYRIRKVSPSGVITTFAGTGVGGYTGDGGLAVNARIDWIYGLAADANGNVYFTSSNRVRKVDTNGIVSTVAGTGSYGSGGDGGPATSATFSEVYGLATDSAGNLYIADYGNHRIRKVDVTTGIISTVAGNGSFGFPSNNVTATGTYVPNPRGIAVDGSGALFITSRYYSYYTQCFSWWNGYYWDYYCNYYYTYYNFVQRVSPAGLNTNLVNGTQPGFSGDGGSAQGAQFNLPWGIAVDGSSNLYVSDYGNQRIRKITPGGIVSTVAGNGVYGFGGDGGSPLAAQLAYPYNIAAGVNGTLYIADYQNHRIRRVSYNESPVARAGDDLTLEATGPTTDVTLDGSTSFDPDAGDTLAFEWRDSNNAVVGTIAQKTLALAVGQHTFTLRVADGSGASSTDSVTIKVEDTTNPNIDITAPVAGTYQLGESVIASFTCTDIASAVTSCTGTSDAGQPINTATAGLKTFSVTATDALGNSSIRAVSYTVAKATPIITWASPSAIVYGTVLGGAQLNASTTIGGTFTYAPGAGTLLNGGNGQTLNVTFTPADPANYEAAMANVTINVLKAAPSVVVVGGTFTYDAGAHPASATATGVGGAPLTPVTITYNGSPAPPVNAGSYNAVASFAGDQNYEAATASGTITIAKAGATLAFNGLQFTYDGSPRPVTVATTPAGLTGVSLTYDGSPTPPTAAGSYAVSASLVNANYEAPSVTGTLVIDKATATITLGSLTATYDGTPKSATASTSPSAVTGVTLIYDGSPAPPTNAGTYTVIATLTNPNYTAPDVTGALVIGKATASIALGNLSHTFDGTPKSATATTTPAALPGVALTYNGSVAPPTYAGSYTVVASLLHPNYAAPDAMATLTVAKASQSISFSPIPGKTFGDPPFVIAAVASSGLPVSFAAAGSCTVSGGTVTITSGGTCTITASQAGGGNYLTAPPISQSFGVAYTWSGVLQPVNQDGTSIFKLGSTVPIKFQLTGASAAMTALGAKIYLAQISNGVTGSELEATSTAAADSGNTFRYDSSSGQYIFNLNTKGMSQGTWQIRIDLLDGAMHTVLISLRR